MARDRDSVLWTSCSSDGELGLFLCPPSPTAPHPPPLLCHPSSCLLPHPTCVSFSPGLDSYIGRKIYIFFFKTAQARKELGVPFVCGQNTTFHLNNLIDFPHCLLFFHPFISLSFFLFFLLPSLLLAHYLPSRAQGRNMCAHRAKLHLRQ